MSAIVRKTYDTDSIVLRRIFAVDPETNTRVSTNSVLVTGTSGQATFQDGSAYLSTIGAPTSASLLSTVTGLGTIGYLSSGTAGDVTSGQLISTVTGLGNIYLSTGGGGEVTKANLTSTTQGLGTLSYLSSAQLISSFIGLSNLAVTQIVAGANISILPTTGIGTVTITATGGGSGSGDVTSTNLTSTTLGLATLGYLSSANDLLSTARFDTLIQSTVKGLATSDYISTSQLTSTVAGIAENLSTVYNISSLGEINISGTTTGFYINTAGANISTLINNNITINTTGGNVNDVDLTSTTRGLATLGYISSSQLTSSFTSTLAGLGNVAVTKIIAGTNVTIDPANGLGIVTINASGGGGGGGSGDVTSTNLTSTTLGLGTLGYISASTLAFSLASTTANLARLGYVSSTALPSTVLGISRFYVSTAALQSNLSSFSTSLVSTFFTRRLFASTITADLLNISTISFGTGSGFITFPFVRAAYISSFSTQTDYAIVNKYISGSQLQFSSIEGNGSFLTYLSTGLESTIHGLSNIAVTKIIAGTNITLSPVDGKGDVTINAASGTNSTIYLSVGQQYVDNAFFSTIHSEYISTGSVYFTVPYSTLGTESTFQFRTSSTQLFFGGYPSSFTTPSQIFIGDILNSERNTTSRNALLSLEQKSITLSGSNEYLDTSGEYFYTVPDVTTLTVTVGGARGGGATDPGDGSSAPGGGGGVIGVLAVTPGETLKLIVGSPGSFEGGPTFGGGGSAGDSAWSGGGRSAIQRETSPGSGTWVDVVTAGGGGGRGVVGAGGEGGVAATAGTGTSPGQPGTGGGGGAAGATGTAGSLETGGDGDPIGGGGGGGGYYGGGGGGQDSGGGGGYSYTAGLLSISFEQAGVNFTGGVIQITYDSSLSRPGNILEIRNYTQSNLIVDPNLKMGINVSSLESTFTLDVNGRSRMTSLTLGYNQSSELIFSTNNLTNTTNLVMNSDYVGAYGPLKISSVSASSDFNVVENSIGTLFLVTNTGMGSITMNLPTNDPALNGWNINVANLLGGNTLSVNSSNLAAGDRRLVVSDGSSYYVV